MTTVPLIPAYDKVTDYIRSCKTEQHIACAQKLVDGFNTVYHNKKYHALLCTHLFLAQVDVNIIYSLTPMEDLLDPEEYERYKSVIQ